MEKPATTATLPARPAGWRGAVATMRAAPTKSRIIGGSLIMLVGSGFVSVINFFYNVALARLLGPASFGNAAAAVTLIMLASSISLSFQLVCAKFVAKNESSAAKAAVYQKLMRQAWFVSVLLASGMVLQANWISSFLNLPSKWETILLAFGIAHIIPLGVRRGGLQGMCAFPRLASSYVVEAFTKTVGAILMVQLGYGVLGVVTAISASVMLTYFLPYNMGELESKPVTGLPASFREGMQAIVFFVGQVVINNIDILLVKHFFSPDQAGLYAAVALVGRVLYFASWSVVSAMFPISAGAKPGEKTASVLVFPIVLVLGMALAFILVMSAFPEFVLHTVFGARFQPAAQLDSLLSLYAAATGLYALSVCVMAYEMSRKIANTGWMQLLFSGGIVFGIYLFHGSLRQVVVVQVVAMVFLLIAVTIPFFRSRPQIEPCVQEAA